MALPRLGQYQMVLQHPRTAFDDVELRDARVETTPMGLPRVISGGFALTYHLTNGRHEWAVRCFHREAADLQGRYQAISAAIRAAPRGPFVPVEYQPGGVLVEGGRYPITKMPWLHAVPLNRHIEASLTRTALERLAERFQLLVGQLAALGIAHGDLQHGNILADGAGNLMLVDYDGMYVPALRGMAANESGHVNYQHPQRATQFDDGLDRFSAIVILVALRALALRPQLWRSYSNGDNLLFKRSDFLDPHGSALFRDLLALPGLRPLAERLQGICQGGYAGIPTLESFLAGGFRPAPRPAILVTARRRQYDVVPAADAAELVRREGDVVTVVGRVTAVQRGLTRFGKPYAFLSFGSYRTGAFTLVLWAQTLDLLARARRPVEGYRGTCVSVTGLISVYRPRTGAGNGRPQLVVTVPSEIQPLAQEEARSLLASVGAPLPAVPAHRPRPRARISLPGRAAALVARLCRRSAGAVPGRPPAARRSGARTRGGRRRAVYRGVPGARQRPAHRLGAAAAVLLGRAGRPRAAALAAVVALAAAFVALHAPVHPLGIALSVLLAGLAAALPPLFSRP